MFISKRKSKNKHQAILPIHFVWKHSNLIIVITVHYSWIKFGFFRIYYCQTAVCIQKIFSVWSSFYSFKPFLIIIKNNFFGIFFPVYWSVKFVKIYTYLFCKPTCKWGLPWYMFTKISSRKFWSNSTIKTIKIINTVFFNR